MATGNTPPYWIWGDNRHEVAQVRRTLEPRPRARLAHGWLSDVTAIGEGSIGSDRGMLAMRYYACVADYPPGIEWSADQ